MTQEEFYAHTCQQMHGGLKDWYRGYKKTRPKERITEIEELTPTMFGKENKRQLSLKAAETKHFFLFSVELYTAASVYWSG